MDQIKKLQKYGAVRTCKIVNENVVTIVITDGFSEKSKNTMDFIKDCIDLFHDFPLIETCITEDNLAIIVLRKYI